MVESAKLVKQEWSDAVAIAAGEIAFAPLSELTAEKVSSTCLVTQRAPGYARKLQGTVCSEHRISSTYRDQICSTESDRPIKQLQISLVQEAIPFIKENR